MLSFSRNRIKLQYLIYESIIAVLVLLIIFLLIAFSFPQRFSEEKIIKILLYDILFTLDSLNQLSQSKINEVAKNVTLNVFLLLNEEGKIKNKLNFSCVCTEDQLLFLNNLFKDGININGRKIYLYFHPTKPLLTEKDFASDGLIIWSCELNDAAIFSLEKFTSYAGILLICDLDSSTYNRFTTFFKEVFGLSSECNNNGNLNVTLVKPSFGSNASYKVYKILTNSNYLIKIPENSIIYNYLSSSVAVCGNDNIFVQNNSVNGIAGATANWYNNNIHIWTANFLRNKNLDQFLTSTSPEDLQLKKILLSFILAISKKSVSIHPKLLQNSIFYVNYHYTEFLEPYLVILSYLTL